MPFCFAAVEPDVEFIGLHFFHVIFKAPVLHGFIERMRFETLDNLQAAAFRNLIGLTKKALREIALSLTQIDDFELIFFYFPILYT